MTRRSAIALVTGGLQATTLPTSTATAQDGDRRLWTFTLDSSPTWAVANDKIFIAGDRSIYSLDITTGDQQWIFENNSYNFYSPTVVSVPRRNLVLSKTSDGLVAVHAEKGTQEWVYENDRRLTSPTMANNIVVIGSRNGHVYGLNGTTGSVEWSFDTTWEVGSKPVVANNTVFFIGRYSIYALDAETGEKNWMRELDRPVDSSLTILDSKIFVSNRNFDDDVGRQYALDPDTGESQWGSNVDGLTNSTVTDSIVLVERDEKAILALDSTTGDEQWTSEIDNLSVLKVTDNTVFARKNDNELYALDVSTGNQQWTSNVDEPSEPVIVGDSIFVGSDDGNIYELNASTGDQQWASNIGGNVYSGSVNGEIIITGSTNGTLVAIDTSVNNQVVDDGNDNEENNTQNTSGTDGTATESDDSILTSLSGSSLMAVGGIITGPVLGYGVFRLIRNSQNGRDQQSEGSYKSAVNSSYAPDSEQSSTDTSSTHVSGTAELDKLWNNATNSVSQAEKSESEYEYQEAKKSYEEAISYLKQAVSETNENNKEKFQSKLEKTQSAHSAVKGLCEQRESVATTLQAAERSFNEAIARYAANEQTVARIRFRQARDAFEEVQQTITESDTEVLAQPIEVSYEQEATIPSLELEELAVLKESTVETLAAVDIESITDLEADPENEAIMPAVVSDLRESAEISSEETALLTILSWWYEGASREITSETVISRRYEQADYGFDQST